MLKVVNNVTKGQISVTNTADTSAKVLIYKDARLVPLYTQQIYEIHQKASSNRTGEEAQEQFMSILPMSQTIVFFEY
jgi:hypothetical protein